MGNCRRYREMCRLTAPDGSQSSANKQRLALSARRVCYDRAGLMKNSSRPTPMRRSGGVAHLRRRFLDLRFAWRRLAVCSCRRLRCPRDCDGAPLRSLPIRDPVDWSGCSRSANPRPVTRSIRAPSASLPCHPSHATMTAPRAKFATAAPLAHFVVRACGSARSGLVAGNGRVSVPPRRGHVDGDASYRQ